MKASPQEKVEFIRNFNALAYEITENAKAKGFWSMGFEARNKPEMLMLMVTELAECLEGLRRGNPPSDHIPNFSAAEEELADCIIRIMDMANAYQWRVAEAVAAKMEFNETRPYMHGGKTC